MLYRYYPQPTPVIGVSSMSQQYSEPYGDFVSLVRQAAYSSDAVDYFDLHGDEAAMRAAWNWLLKEQHDSFLALVKHVQMHADAIIAGIGEPPADVPAEPPQALMRSSQLGDWVYTALSHYAIAAERATRDPSVQTPDATRLPQPGKWERRGNLLTMRTIIPKE